MKTDRLTNPHDKFFKESFGRKEIALSFIQEYLPKELCNRMEYATLEITKCSYIDKELSEHFSDILYTIKIGRNNAFIYLLFEHKSYADRWSGYQILRNMVKIWEEYFKQHKKINRLPIIVPLVIYHGKETWSIARNLVPLFDDIPEAQKYIPDFNLEVFDISHIPDNQIKGKILLQAHFLLLKYIFNRDLVKKVPEILGVLNRLSNKTKATEYLEVMLRYMLSSVDSKQSESLKEKIEKTIEPGGELMPTIAEELIKKGKIEGKIESTIELTEKMIQKGMSTEDIHDITGLRAEEIEAIRKRIATK